MPKPVMKRRQEKDSGINIGAPGSVLRTISQ